MKAKPSTGNAFLALSWRLELFTHIVPVPISIYFSATLVPMTEDQRMTAFIAGTISGTLMLILGMAWRYLRLRKVQKFLAQGDLLKHKKGLLNHPLQEAIVIALRWLTGVPLAHLMFAYHYGEFHWALHASTPFLLLIITPVSMAAYFYISESVLRKPLSGPDLRSLPVPGLFRLGYFPRLLFTVVALMLMPLTMQTYLIYQFIYGKLQISNPLFHIGIVLILFLIPTVIAAFAVARAVRAGLGDTRDVLSRLGEGHFDMSASARTADEFGEQAIHLNNVIERLRTMYQKIEDMNQNLEKQVKDRTLQLENTLKDVRALKAQQDGDYYLTSHLLRPLSSQEIRSETVQIEQFVKQKKEFQFRDQHGEIGGDLCTAHELSLRDRYYVVFLNGDAMGKSIQGAGGAIVMGTVFKSIVARTDMVASQRSRFPEQWLRDAYTELQTVFAAFDGFMQASASIGLIDEVNGFLYFINADHPGLVLYRNEKASFLPDERSTMRFGIEGLGNEFHLNTFQLQAGDVILAGSDGRDDLVVGTGPDGVRQFNDNENAILQHVEKTGADLAAMVESLEQSGELADDLSLLRISFRENEVGNSVNGTGDLLERAASAYRNREFLKSAGLYAEYAGQDPSRVDVFFQASYCYKLGRSYGLACDFGERCRIRDPHLVKNLINLGDVYRLMGDRFRARTLLEQALLLEPENSSARQLASALQHPAA